MFSISFRNSEKRITEKPVERILIQRIGERGFVLKNAQPHWVMITYKANVRAKTKSIR